MITGCTGLTGWMYMYVHVCTCTCTWILGCITVPDMALTDSLNCLCFNFSSSLCPFSSLVRANSRYISNFKATISSFSESRECLQRYSIKATFNCSTFVE